MNFITRAAQRIVKYRFYVIVFVLAVSAVCLPGLFRLNITVDIQDYFLEDDPILTLQKDYEALFPGNEFIGVLVESDDVFSRDSLELINELGEILKEAFPGSGEVLSPASLPGSLTGGRTALFDGNILISTPEEMESLRDAASASPLINGTYFSADYKEAWIILPLSEKAAEDVFDTGQAAWEALQGIDSGGIRLTPAGVPVFAYRKQVEMLADLTRVLVFGAVAALFLSVIILRSFQGVVGTLAVFICSMVVVLGVQGWMGVTVDSAFMAVPILLTMGVSIGYSVHIHRFFLLSLDLTGKRRESVVTALTRTIRPIFFTVITTVAALLSFLLVSIRPIRWVGLTSSVSILTAFVMSVLIFPAILAVGRDRVPVKGRSRRALLIPLFSGVTKFLTARAGLVLLFFLLAASAAIVGVFRLEVDFDAVKMMGTRLPHMSDQLRVGESEIAVGEYMNLVITLPDEGFNSADSIYLLDELENRVSTIAGVRRVRSVTGILREINSLMHRRAASFAGLPENPVSMEALIRLMEGLLPEERRNWLDDRYENARVFIEITDFSSKKIELLIEKVEDTVVDVFPSDVGLMFSGSTYQVARMNQYITRGLIRSITTALLTISCLMILVFRSFKWGLIAMIPNVFPVLIAGGILGLAGIPLEFVTMTAAPIILGLAVDDTIHFMSFLKDDLIDTGNFPVSLQRAYHSVGTAITETTVILCVTFLVFFISRINSIRYMGLIAAAGMTAAYLADLLVTPVLVQRFIKKSS